MYDVYVTGPNVHERLELLRIAKELKVKRPKIEEGGYTFYWFTEEAHQVEAKEAARMYKATYGGKTRIKEGNVFTSLLGR